MAARTPGLRHGTPKEAGLSQARLDHARELAAGWVEDGTHPALEILVARRGVIALHEAFGRHGPAPDARPLKCGDLLPTTSMIKPVTAALLMLLVEDGMVGLTRPVQQYIPEFSGDGREAVCVHHLLTHTSGLYMEIVAEMAAITERLSTGTRRFTDVHHIVDAMLQQACEIPLVRPPGKEMSYDTLNYELAGEIIRRVSGHPIQELAAERIFTPLGMPDTFYSLPDERREDVATVASDDVTRAVPFVNVGTPCGAIGVYTTASDMARFCQMFLDGGRGPDGQVLHRSSIKAMSVNQIPGVRATGFGGQDHAEASWSLGWGVGCEERWPSFPTFPPGVLQHDGAVGTVMWVDPKRDLVGVYLSFSEIDLTRGQFKWGADLFVNAVYTALED